MNVCGYETKTTFWDDFSIAEHFGDDAIQDTYDRAFKAWKTHVVYITELVMVLNWKCWTWHEKNEEYSDLYADLYIKAREWCLDNLKGDNLSYFIQTTD